MGLNILLAVCCGSKTRQNPSPAPTSPLHNHICMQEANPRNEPRRFLHFHVLLAAHVAVLWSRISLVEYWQGSDRGSDTSSVAWWYPQSSELKCTSEMIQKRVCLLLGAKICQHFSAFCDFCVWIWMVIFPGEPMHWMSDKTWRLQLLQKKSGT